MKAQLRVVNRTRQTVLVEHGRVAADPWTRLRGLMGRRTFSAGDGLLLHGEQAIHTFGMFFPIDIVYLDSERRVLRAQRAMAAARIGPIVRGTRDILELPTGTLAATHTREGDELEFQFTS